MLGKWLIGPNWFGSWDPSDLLSHAAPEWPGAPTRPALRLSWLAPIPIPGSSAIGGCFAAVLQAAGGGLLLISEKGCLHLNNFKKQRLRRSHGQPNCRQPAARATSNSRFSNLRIRGGTAAARHVASLLLSRVAALFVGSSSSRDAFDAVSVAIAYSSVILPPSDDV